MNRIDSARRMGLMNKGRKSFRKGITLEREYGVDKASQIRQVMSNNRLGKTYEEIYGENAEMVRNVRHLQGVNNNPFQGKRHSDKTKDILRSYRVGKTESLETRLKVSEASRLHWLDPECGNNKQTYWDKLAKAKNCKPNGLEKLSGELLDNAFGVGTWQFVGDFKLIIRNEKLNKRRCPDFKHRELNKLIEVFNEYDKKKGFGSVEDYKRVTEEFYRLCGYDVIFFTQEQVKNTPNNMIEEVRCFVCS